jgi:hypothetical protein
MAARGTNELLVFPALRPPVAICLHRVSNERLSFLLLIVGESKLIV